MDAALAQPTPPVHAALETYDVVLRDDVSSAPQLGVRVRASGPNLAPDTFLGFYQGYRLHTRR